jgi:hypothetical protein
VPIHWIETRYLCRRGWHMFGIVLTKSMINIRIVDRPLSVLLGTCPLGTWEVLDCVNRCSIIAPIR